MSIYAKLKDRLPEENPRASSRQATLILGTNGDPEKNDPLLGISYQCDFRSEEESGTGAMTHAFTKTADPSSFLAQERAKTKAVDDVNTPFHSGPLIPEGLTQANLVYQDDQVVAFAAQPHIYDPEREINEGKAFIRSNEAYARGLPSMPMAFYRKSRDELAALAKERNIKGRSKMNRDALIEAIHRHDHQDAPETYIHPGWFHFGNLLVLPRSKDVFGEVLDLLVEAAQAGLLSVGGGGMNVFGSGFSFFDERDLSEDAKTEIAQANQAYREDMEALRPVAETVKERHGFYFLGRPQRSTDGETRYWLNGAGLTLPSGRRSQPFGWYTLQELLGGKYVEDAEAKEDENDERKARV